MCQNLLSTFMKIYWRGNPLSVNLRMLMSIIFQMFFNCSDMLMKEQERSLLMTQTLKCLQDSIQGLDRGI